MRPVLLVKKPHLPRPAVDTLRIPGTALSTLPSCFQPGFFNPAGALYGWRGDKQPFSCPSMLSGGFLPASAGRLGASRCWISVHPSARTNLIGRDASPAGLFAPTMVTCPPEMLSVRRIPGEAALGIDLSSQFRGIASWVPDGLWKMFVPFLPLAALPTSVLGCSQSHIPVCSG